MAVNNVATLGYAQYAMQSKNSTKSNSTTQTQSEQNQSTKTQSKQNQSVKTGDAFKLDISNAAKQSQETQQTPNQMFEGFSVDDADAQKTSNTSNVELADALQENLDAQQGAFLNVMIQAMTGSNEKLQGWLDEGVGILNFDGVQIDAARFGLPEVATNPEDAAKAIAPGGEWSVEAVAGRIFDLATAIAGDDPEKLSQMKDAIGKGFEEAIGTFKNMTGQSEMPSITGDTQNRINELFDKRLSELNGNKTGVNGTSGASLTD